MVILIEREHESRDMNHVIQPVYRWYNRDKRDETVGNDGIFELN